MKIYKDIKKYIYFYILSIDFISKRIYNQIYKDITYTISFKKGSLIMTLVNLGIDFGNGYVKGNL